MQSPMIPVQFPVQTNPAVLGGAMFSARTKNDSDAAFVVLYIDRRRRAARAVRMGLGTPGTRIQTPIGSEEALACIRGGTIDLIVDTQELPAVAALTGPVARDGVTAAIALSSRAALESGTRLRREGFDIYYLPPVVLTDLINDVAGWLRAADAA